MSQVLVIDDAVEIHKLVAAHLAALRIPTLCALNGPTGLRMACRAHPDLILLDVDLGGRSGFEVCRRLKAHRATADIPVIFLTGSDEPHAVVAAFELGAIDYVVKPFQGCELTARIRSALETRRLIRELNARANTDGLTGLPNRASFMKTLDHCVARAARGADGLFAVLFIDTDGFKEINDRFGHAAGDALLRHLAGEVRAAVRQSHVRHPDFGRDFVARLGGDEFLVLLDNLRRPEDAMTVAEHLRQTISRPVSIGGQVMQVGASIGIRLVDGGSSAAQILSDSDAAMYHAKTHGKGRCFLLGARSTLSRPLSA